MERAQRHVAVDARGRDVGEEQRRARVRQCRIVHRGVQRVALIAYSTTAGDATWLYVVRLAAFVLILWAIVDKNRAASGR